MDNKKYYLENNKLKLIRHIVSYNEIINTDLLYRESNVYQYLNSDKDLEELEIILKRRGIEYKVDSIDVSLYEEYENTTMSLDEIDSILNPDIETIRNVTINKIEQQYSDKLASGIEINLKNSTEIFSCTPEDTQYIQLLLNKNEDEYTIFNIDKKEIKVDREDLENINNVIGDFVLNEFSNKQDKISKINSSKSIKNISKINL